MYVPVWWVVMVVVEQVVDANKKSPVTKLGRFVKPWADLYPFSSNQEEPNQRHTVKDEVTSWRSFRFRSQTRAGQRTRFKAFVVVGLGVKCSKEVATAIRGAIILVKLIVIHPKLPSPLPPMSFWTLIRYQPPPATRSEPEMLTQSSTQVRLSLKFTFAD